MTVDRRTLNVLLAALDIEQRELADRMGYDKTYVVNIFNGFTQTSNAFKQAFGDALGDLLLGGTRRAKRLPAAPLVEFLETRARGAECRSAFYENLGLNPQSWHRGRKYVSESQLDRICCALGVHPSSIYGSDYEVAL